MNEAEFQNKVIEICRNLFPGFQKQNIRCQGNFTIKFGHHNVTINGNTPSHVGNRGIYDVLVMVEDKPLIMFELKKPGIQLSSEDIRQGVSYARLTDPITPITVISNGKDTRIVNTYTKEDILNKDLNEDLINRIQDSMTLAATDIYDSVAILLEKDIELLFQLIKEQTKNEETILTGPAHEIQKPIISDFQVSRESLSDFIELTKKKQFVMLHGDAFIGKTNFLFQYINDPSNTENACLYVNVRDIQYSVFDKLANQLINVLGRAVTALEVKQWVLLHFSSTSTKKIKLIYDHIYSDCSELIKSEIAELTDIFNLTGNHIILAVDTSSVEPLRVVSNRLELTRIGNSFTDFKLDEFTTTEFLIGNAILKSQHNTLIQKGGSMQKNIGFPDYGGQF